MKVVERKKGGYVMTDPLTPSENPMHILRTCHQALNLQLSHLAAMHVFVLLKHPSQQGITEVQSVAGDDIDDRGGFRVLFQVGRSQADSGG